MNTYWLTAWAEFNRDYWRHSKDRRRTLQIILAGLATVGLIALTAFLLL